MPPGVGTIACGIRQAAPSKGRAGIRAEQDKGTVKGSRVRLDAQGAAIGNHAGLYLRGPDSCTVACVQIPATLKVNQGKEQSDKRGFVHTQKRPAGKRARGKGKG